MSAPKGKAAGVLDTPEAAYLNQHPDSKRFTTLRARAALAGLVLYQSTDDKGRTVYVVSRWALTKLLDTLDATEIWLDAVTGVRHD